MRAPPHRAGPAPASGRRREQASGSLNAPSRDSMPPRREMIAEKSGSFGCGAGGMTMPLIAFSTSPNRACTGPRSVGAAGCGIRMAATACSTDMSLACSGARSTAGAGFGPLERGQARFEAAEARQHGRQVGLLGRRDRDAPDRRFDLAHAQVQRPQVHRRRCGRNANRGHGPLDAFDPRHHRAQVHCRRPDRGCGCRPPSIQDLPGASGRARSRAPSARV